jgi:hypothetical protein
MDELTVERYGVHDFELPSKTRHRNPFMVDLRATFTHESGRKIKNLPGFYDGDGTWVVRFSPTLEGVWKGLTASQDKQLAGKKLPAVRCVASTNPAIRGQLRIDPKHPRRFICDDGLPFIPLGFEFDWTAAFHQRRGQSKAKPVDPGVDLWTPACELLARRGFNWIITNVYAIRGFSDQANEWVFNPPDLAPWEGANEQPRHEKLNLAFWKDYDGAIGTFHRLGLMVHLMIQVQNKGVKWPARRSPADDLYWKYVAARYQAYCNIVWDVSKESFNLRKETGDHAYTLDRMAFVRDHDAYGHLFTVHDPEGGSYARMGEPDCAGDFVSDQIHVKDTGRPDFGIQAASILNREAARRFRLFDKPYFNIESAYEIAQAEGLVPTYHSHNSRPWEETLMWMAALYAGGGYPGYYYNSTSWDLVKFDPEPPSWRRYRTLMDLLESMPLNEMVPDNDYVERGMCLARHGRDYFIFLPAGGNEQADLTGIAKETPARIKWLDLLTGQTIEKDCGGRGFTVELRNPLEFTTHPCVIYIRAQV